MRSGGGSRSSSSSSSSSSSYSSSSSGDGGEFLFDLIVWLWQSSMFFRHIMAGGLIALGLLVIRFSVDNVEFPQWAQVIEYGLQIFFLTAWAGFVLWGLYLDIADLYWYIRIEWFDDPEENYESDIRSIAGIGPRRGQKLNKAGIYTLRDLASADVDTVVAAGLSETLAKKFMKTAQDQTGIS